MWFICGIWGHMLLAIFQTVFCLIGAQIRWHLHLCPFLLYKDYYISYKNCQRCILCPQLAATWHCSEINLIIGSGQFDRDGRILVGWVHFLLYTQWEVWVRLGTQTFDTLTMHEQYKYSDMVKDQLVEHEIMPQQKSSTAFLRPALPIYRLRLPFEVKSDFKKLCRHHAKLFQ